MLSPPRRSPLLALFALTLTLAACGQRSEFTDCDAGETWLVGDARYCVFSQELIIEGFACPQLMVPHQVPGGMVCSPHGTDIPLPDPLQDPFDMEDQLDPCAVQANCPTSPDPMLDMDGMSPDQGNSPFTEEPDPALYGQPVPDANNRFLKIYRSFDKACVIDEQERATCWGSFFFDPDNDAYQVARGPVANTTSLALGPYFWCGLDAMGRMSCQGQGAQGQIVPQPPQDDHRYVNLSAYDDGSLCGRDAQGFVQCHNWGLLSGKLSSLGLAVEMGAPTRGSQAFSFFELMGSMGGRTPFTCGVLTNGHLYCADMTTMLTAQELAGEVAYTQAYALVGPSSSYTVSALRADGAVQVWRVSNPFVSPFLNEVAAPEGRFIELYSGTCGLRDDSKVVCWDEAIDLPAGVTAPVEVLYDAHPRAFWVHHMTRALERSWCAVSLSNAITCSPF